MFEEQVAKAFGVEHLGIFKVGWLMNVQEKITKSMWAIVIPASTKASSFVKYDCKSNLQARSVTWKVTDGSESAETCH